MPRLRFLPLFLLLVSLMNARAHQAPLVSPTFASSVSGCPGSPRVADYPSGGPEVHNDWYANADRTIWATFWGWDFVRRGADKPDPKTGYVPGQKVLWHKPTDQPLTVVGRRIDGEAGP